MDKETTSNLVEIFVNGAIISGIAGTFLLGINYLGRFNFPHDLPDYKIKKVVDESLDSVVKLGQMERLYKKTAEKEPVSSSIKYAEIKVIRRCNLDVKRLPLSRLERKVAEVVGGLVKPHPAVKVKAEPYDTLEEIKQKGEELGAESFSFQNTQMIHGDYVFNVLYHKTN